MIALGHAHEMVEMDDLISTLFIPKSICRYLTDTASRDFRRNSMYASILVQAGNLHYGVAPENFQPNVYPPVVDIGRMAQGFVNTHMSACPENFYFTAHELQYYVTPEACAITGAIWTHIAASRIPTVRNRHLWVGGRKMHATEPVISVAKHEEAGTYISWR